MKLTAELILQSPSHINASKDYELDLRGNKIPMIENLGATKDLYASIDFTDNEIHSLGNFPVLRRLEKLYIGNNKIKHISESIGMQLPNLNTIVLSNNYIEELVDLEGLKTLKNLDHLALLGNPVSRNKDFRSWVIYRMPQIRILNFSKVKMAEREAAKALYETEAGELTSQSHTILQVQPANTFEPGENLGGSVSCTAALGTEATQGSHSSAPELDSAYKEAEAIRQKALEAMSNAQSMQIDSVLRSRR